ncbi:prenyltransferase/squalene oxidase repeat-containing protein [Catenibacterium sp.]|uniref:prenyltransferase/squalene oxidase repeat-containing protein n=1 Tax=Catenibacterium sp. TaxID=2049022 RepID=UPI002E762320|nr:prenyltransferase/squalene oxidase repeat-containing protein [Catenibacterium sp.]MEE0043122.1 prenyltransferase/squalene oxidase repeat-containing protein [Catenibacterium sp.]
MKKIFTVLTSIALTFALSFSAAFANDDALIKSQNYLKTITLDSPDAVIAYEATGMEADYKADALLNNFKETDYVTASYGDLAKSIIAISLLGENPKDFNKTNLVEILENRVQEDGTLTNDVNGGCGATIWTLMALETVNSPKVKAVADKLSTMAMENGAYWYEYQGPNADLDTTGWAMEALSVAGRSTYDAAISKAYTFVQSKLNSTDGYYDNWGGNADTQSCVLEGLSVAGYTLDTNAYNYLLSYQNEDGTFNALNYSTSQLEPNAYASVEGARALGVINNGSFVLRARTTTPVVTEPETPTKPSTPTTPGTTTPAVKPETTTTEPKKETVKVVNTGDNTNVMAYVVAAIAAVGVIVLVIKSKKK